MEEFLEEGLVERYVCLDVWSELVVYVSNVRYWGGMICVVIECLNFYLRWCI